MFILRTYLASNVKACKYNDEQCLRDTMNDIFANKFDGFPELALPSLDPLNIKALDLVQGSKSPVNIVMNLRNVTFSGLSKAKAYKASGFSENPQGAKLDIRFKAPKIAIIGPYKAFGKVLVLPIQGDGIGNMTLGKNQRLR